MATGGSVHIGASLGLQNTNEELEEEEMPQSVFKKIYFPDLSRQRVGSLWKKLMDNRQTFMDDSKCIFTLKGLHEKPHIVIRGENNKRVCYYSPFIFKL